MLVVDTTVWVDYFNGQNNLETGYLDQALAREFILVGDLVLAEILQGFRNDRDFEQALTALGKFQQVEMLNPRVAIQSARNYRTLRKKGVTVRKTIDCIIATYCISENHTLLHRDHDYAGFEQHLGLMVVHAV